MKRDLKKFGAIALIVVLCVSFAAPSLAAQQFTDIPTTWAKDAVEYAIENGILVGYNGKINPDE
ncbi:MAG: S-layer homology domain-containing protein, partial [Tissierellia bacterium]|nr:S-layer homology domain-containing protein [Tissierellia bacterium]